MEELAQDDGVTVMEKLSKESTLAAFVELTTEKQLLEDWIRLIVAILAKVCDVQYQEIVLVLFNRICTKEFLEQLLLHIVKLDTDTHVGRRAAVGDFFANFCRLAHGMLRYIPDVASERLEILVKKAIRALEDLPPFNGSENTASDLRAIMEKIAVEKERLEKARMSREKPKPPRQSDRLHSFGPPPEDFRELSVFPTPDDLMPHRPYLRRNVVRGPYDDVEHYLDVQFRLLREDFVRPLRDGVREYGEKLLQADTVKAGKRKGIRVNNIRVYEKVNFVGLKTEKDRIGLELCFDPEHKMGNVNWEYSKRLMTGTLLVLSRDLSFANVILVTVSRRHTKELEKGRILVELCEGAVRDELFTGYFRMVECQVFFGAYSHVLKALKNLDEDSFPLKEYLVYASNRAELPRYQERAVAENVYFALPLKSNSPVGVANTRMIPVDQPNAWPSAHAMGLDKSQYEALQGAITNKLMLVQGPPGTGKTFLGLKIAASLLHNKELWTSEREPRPMLVVCYTNHALDQFLVGLLPATKSIVRVGGGCKEPLLEGHEIYNMRRSVKLPRELYLAVREHREKFIAIGRINDALRFCSSQIKTGGGILSEDVLRAYGAITAVQHELLRRTSVLQWLGLEDLTRQTEAYCRIPRCELTEVILHPDDWDKQCITDPAMLDRVQQDVTFALSWSVLDQKKAELEGHRDQRAGVDAVARLQAAMKNGLLSPEIPPLPENFDMHGARLGRVRPVVRWQIYRLWSRWVCEHTLDPVLEEVNGAYAAAANVYQEWSMVEDQAVMATKLVIGMTTSYAASRQKILKALKPSIVIVEEAAEVLEAHVLVSLTGDVEHLIMIGDHQQLRPSPAVFQLAKDYHLDVSLFERLINNGVRCVTLGTQHRMRPEISRLICPAIYPQLRDHESVRSFPDVRGVTKNLFFVNHSIPEEEVKDAQSYRNRHEADFLSSLAHYLWLQGYDSSKITILSTYKGQQYYFSKLRSEGGHSHLKDLRITVVDNYQGEECDIILLSLVRSNPDDVVGFLKTSNRVCVALSRARHGFFIIGNMANMTAADTVWRAVRAVLEAQGSLGPALTLRCEVHGTATPVGSAADFARCPQGGCSRLCHVLLECGHLCQQVCHVQDREHKNARCQQPCQKEVCPERHMCPDRCYLPCRPCRVPKVEELPCGHSVRMPCHQDPLTVQCRTKVPVTLPACGHNREAKCYQTAGLDKLQCEVACAVRMACGHVCGKTCHVLDDPSHVQVKCMRLCGQKKVGCTDNHRCAKMCHEECEECTVIRKKTLPCGHELNMKCKDDPLTKECVLKCARTQPCGHKCPKLCHQPCAPCQIKVPKRVPRCGHTQQMECGTDPAQFTDCGERCGRRLSCGHPCKQKCRVECDAARCLELVPYRGLAACGHAVQLACSKSQLYDRRSPFLLRYCKEPCRVPLECEHQCRGTCGSCLQGRFHEACKSNCGRTLICGHSCNAPCAKGCPPCQRQCPVVCAHSSCGKRCGEVCVPCKEPCLRRCEHKACPLPCGDLCPDEPCNKPCTEKVRPCGHDCIGLCGEVCLCRECTDEETFEIFFGEEDDKNARFIMLADCKHIFESRGLDTWMNEQEGEITQKECPRCKSGIKTSKRYSNSIKRNAVDVMKVKMKLFGDWTTIVPAAKRVREILTEIGPFQLEMVKASNLLSKVDCSLKKTEERYARMVVLRGARATPPLSLMEIQSLEQYARILRTLSKVVGEACALSEVSHKPKVNDSGKAELFEFVNELCSNLLQRDAFRISQQEASDVGCELERFQKMSLLCQLEGCPGFNTLTGADRDVYHRVSEVIRGLLPYPKDKHDLAVQTSLEHLAKKASITVTRQELDMVNAAMGMNPGHWFKCRNGHPYFIGECGGAMEESKCNECGAPIGGRNHTLRADNTLASEIDHASGPAYPTALQRY